MQSYRHPQARQTVAVLRFAATRHPHDRALYALVAELREADDRVDAWWNAHDVAQKRHGIKRYAHPRVGALALYYEALLLADDGDQILTIYTAEPGSPDGERLAKLAHAMGITADGSSASSPSGATADLPDDLQAPGLAGAQGPAGHGEGDRDPVTLVR